MNEKLWHIVTGNAGWIEATSQFPETHLVKPINWFMRATISIMVLFLYGRSFHVHYRNDDWVTMKWDNFKYISNCVYTHDGITVYNRQYLGSD